MAGTEFRTAHLSGVNSTTCRGANTDRCLNKELGGKLQCNLNRVDVVCSGNEKPHIVLEFLVIKLAIQLFLKPSKHKAILFQEDNMVALTYYLLKMGVSQNLKLVQLAQVIWDHLLQCGATLTAEHVLENYQSRFCHYQFRFCHHQFRFCSGRS